MRALTSCNRPAPCERSDAGGCAADGGLAAAAACRLLTACPASFSALPLSPRVERKFSDKEVCKAFLCGFCPHEEFRRTKNDCGDCPLLHDEGCRQQWEELDDRAKERYG